MKFKQKNNFSVSMAENAVPDDYFHKKYLLRSLRHVCLIAMFAVKALAVANAQGQVIDSDTDILNDVNTFSSIDLSVRRYVTLPGADARINSFTLRPGDSDAFYTTSQTGVVYRITDNGFGQGTATEWFDAKDGGFFTNTGGNTHGGLRSIAFHPDFNNPAKAGYGKFYGSHSTSQKNQAWSAPLIGSSAANGNPESVVSEWTYNFNTSQVDQNSYRELFRVSNNPRFDHPIKSISFNTAAKENDGDYGLLYIGYGDAASSQEFGGNAFGSGRDLTNALGKVLRVNPLGNGTGDYTTPGNTYAEDGNGNTLAEIYSAGHRNPHHLNFGRRSNGDTVLIVAEVGQDLIEEVNIIDINMNTNGEINGFDYGWGNREGTFVRRLGDGGYGVQQTDLGNTNPGGPQGSAELLPLNDHAIANFIYPALQMDHNDPDDVTNSNAISGGPVINGRYYYGNFSGNNANPGGQIYSVALENLLSQKINLEAGETPDDLSWIDDLTQHRISWDHDNNPLTDDLKFDTFAQFLSQENASTNRTDFRFGMTPDGFLLISSKRNGAVYIVDNIQNIPEPTTLAALALMSLPLLVRGSKRNM